MRSVQRRHEGSATVLTGHLGYALTGSSGGGHDAGAIFRATDRRFGGATQQEFHQLLQAPVLRSPLGQATTAGSPLGEEAGRAARSSPSSPSLGPARATPAGYRVQTAGVPLVRPGVARRRPRAAPAPSSPKSHPSSRWWTNTGSL